MKNKLSKILFTFFVLLFSLAGYAQVSTKTGTENTTHKLLSITRYNPATENTNADILIFRATFDIDVQNVDATDFEIDGTTTAAITNVVAVEGASVYKISVAGGDLDNFNGRVGLNLRTDHDIIYADRYSILTEQPAIDESYLVDNTITGSISVTTTVASSVTSNSALSGGEVTIVGETTVINRGVCWNTSQNPTIYSNITSDGNESGVFTSSITGLIAGTTYYYRAYATDSHGTVYGLEYSFTTPCVAPMAATGISGSTEVCPGGSTSLTVEGGTLNSATDWKWYTESCGGALVGTGATINVSPLASTTYYVRAEGNCVTPSACVSVTVNVDNTVVPVINCPADIVTNNDVDNCSAVINDIAPIDLNDNCGTPSVTYTIAGATTKNGITDASGSIFNPGISTVTYVAVNNANNSASCSFTVTVTDSQNPIIVAPSNVSISSDANSCYAVVNNIAPVSVSDNCGTPSVTYTLSGKTSGEGVNDASGTIFNIGETIVEYTAVDGSGNMSTASFTVTINESIKPEAHTQNLTVSLNNMGLATITAEEVDNNSTDNCGIDTLFLDKINFECGNLGENTVTLTVVDNAGNTDTETAVITVLDESAPMFEDYKDIIVMAGEGESSTVVTFRDPIAWDNCYATIEQIEGQPSGSAFDIGVSKISYRATDLAGNSSEMSFTITVLSFGEVSGYVPSGIGYCFNSIDSINVQIYSLVGLSPEWYYDRELTKPILVKNNKIVAPQESTVYYVKFSGISNAGLYAFPMSITVFPLPTIDAGEDTRTYVGKELQMEPTYRSDYKYFWTVETISEKSTINDLLGDETLTKLLFNDNTIYSPLFTGKTTDDYKLKVTATDNNGCENSDSLIVSIVDIKPHNGFTPNNDGYHDFWVIDNIDVYPNNVVKIYNRNNVLVYEKKSYDNTWQGTFDTKTGQTLPSGTYFYVIKLEEVSKIYKGTVTILTND